MTLDARRSAPSALRNRDVILGVLAPNLPARGLVLEIASGSGEHVAHFAAALGPARPQLIFQPSDPDPLARASIDAWAAHGALENILPALALDVAGAPWPVTAADAIVCINMIHIAPWSAAEGLVRGAGRVLPEGGLLYLYGPFRVAGSFTAASNADFDESLRARNPEWGLRDLEAVAGLAATHGFGAPRVEEMPANNLSVIFRRET